MTKFSRLLTKIRLDFVLKSPKIIANSIKIQLPIWALFLLRYSKAFIKLRHSEKSARRVLKFKTSKDPKTLQDKILFKMYHDKNPMLSCYADKVEVLEYLLSRAGDSVW